MEQEVQCCIHKQSPIIPILGRINPIPHIDIFLKTHSNIALPSMPFSLKRLEILHQERREQVKTIVMEHFNGILFHKYGPTNKQNTNQSCKDAHGECFEELKNIYIS